MIDRRQCRKTSSSFKNLLKEFEAADYLLWDPKETREGWPLLTVETEVNGDTKSTMKGVLPCMVGLLGLLCRYKRFLFCLGCSSRPNTNILFLTVNLFNSFVSTAQQAGQQPC